MMKQKVISKRINNLLHKIFVAYGENKFKMGFYGLELKKANQFGNRSIQLSHLFTKVLWELTKRKK